MADNFSTKISKTLLAHDIKLAQVDASMRKDVMAVMNALEKKTIDNVMKIGSPSTYKSVSAQNKALNILTTSQAPTTAKAYKQMSDVTGVSLTKLAAVESEFVVNTLNRAMTVDIGLNKLSPEVIRLLPGKALIEGAPFTTWFKQQAEDFQLKFSNEMREGIVNGETIDDMVRRVRGTRANGFKDGFVSPKKGHAQTLVRSSVQATANKARESVYAANSNVIKGQQWLSTLDSRTSDICISLDGSAWFLSGKPMAGTVHSYLGPPPAHFNCLVGGAYVKADSRITGASARHFEGEVVVFRTATGHGLTCTPNHPILTRRGWVPAHLLEEGSEVVCNGASEWVLPRDPDTDNGIARIEDVAQATLIDPELTTVEVPVRAPDFHGDGAGSEVAIIATDCHLRDTVDSPFLEDVEEHFFVRRSAKLFAPVSLARLCALLAFGERDFAHGTSVVRGARKCAAFVGRHVRTAHTHLFGARAFLSSVFGEYAFDGAGANPEMFSNSADPDTVVEHSQHDVVRQDNSTGTYWDTTTPEYAANRSRADTEIARDIVDGKTGEIFFDDVVFCRRENFSGQVYNLETVDGWYTANAIITHNCRSTLVPVTKSFSELSKSKSAKEKLRKIPKAKQRGLRASMDGAVSDKLNYEEWLRSKSPGFQLKVLGPTKLRLWQSGQLSLKNLIDQSHNPLSIDALVLDAGVPKITLDQALETAATAELPVTAHGVEYKSSKQWYDEFADKNATVDSILAAEDAATVKALDDIAKKLEKTPTSVDVYKSSGKWTAERAKVHDKIIRDFLNKATVAAAKPLPGEKPSYVMFGGRGGSGKGAFTTPKSKGGLQVIDEDRYIVLDADAIKGQLPGYEGWNAFSYHAESSELFNRITAIAARLKINVVHDMTMRTVHAATKRSAIFAKKGYDMEGYYMFLPPQTAAKRAISRFRTFDNDFSGRYVPPEVVLGNTQNEVAFDAMKKKFSKWKFYDNQGDAPVLVGKGGDFAEDTIKPLSSVATKQADEAAKAAAKADDVAAAAAAKAAAKAADEAMAAKLAKEAAEKEAAAAQAAQFKAEQEALEAAHQAKIADAKAAYVQSKITDKAMDDRQFSFLVANTEAEEIKELLEQAEKAKAAVIKAAKETQKKLADAQAIFMTDSIAGKTVADDVLDVLVKNMTSAEIMEFKAQALTAKKAIEAAAAAQAAEAEAVKTINAIKAQKATFEKRALVKLQKQHGEFDTWTPTEQLEAIAKQVEVDKAAKKITDGISNYKKAIINGKVPPPAATKVFNSLTTEKQNSIIADIAKKTGQQVADATPPTLAQVLDDFNTNKINDKTFIEQYHKANGTWTPKTKEMLVMFGDDPDVIADTADNLYDKGLATVAKAQTSAPGTSAAQLKNAAQQLVDEFNTPTSQLSTEQFKVKASSLLGKDYTKVKAFEPFQKLQEVAGDLKVAEAHIAEVTAAKTAAKVTSKTVAQIQDEAQEFLDKFRFGEFDEKQALTAMAEILGDTDSLPTLLGMSGKLLDDNLDLMLQGVKGIAKSTDKAKYFIKQQGLEIVEDVKTGVPPPKPPPPPEPKPVAPAPTSSVTEPPNMNDLTRIGEQAGSNPGGLFQDATTGQKWYVKTPGTEEIARNEVLAAKLYEKMGIEVPDLHVVQFNGKPSVASRIVDGLQENSTGLRAGEIAGVNEGFVADAFLANWDVVGLGYDNLLVKAGRAVRVDTGGALRFRAQGGLKGNAFGKTVGEIDSLRNPANNTQSAGVFGRITDAELEAGARKVVSLTDDDITQLVATYGPLDVAENKALVDTLIARRNDIKKRFKIRAKKQPPAKPPEDLNAPVTTSELQQINDARGNGFVLTRDKDSIEDQAILAWNETTSDGVKRSMLQLKIRGDAVKNLNDEIAKTVQKKPSTVYLAELDGKIESTIRGLKHRANNDMEFDQKILMRLNDALDEHSNVRSTLASALKRGEISKASLDKFDATYEGWVKGLVDIRGKNGVGGKVQSIDSLPDKLFKRDVIGDIELTPKATDKGAQIRWAKKDFNFEEKKLKNGNVVVTGDKVNPIRSGGGWYETTIDDVTIRYYSRDTVSGNFALQDRLELIAPGKTHEQAIGVLRKLGINTDRATDLDAEELYLRQIMAHATSSSSGARKTKFASIISELAGIADDSARLDRARKLASEYMHVKDITKTAAYNYRGQYQAFGHGQRHLTRPDLVGPEWDDFTNNYRLHHANTSNSSLPQVIDMVLNSGGNFISTTDKLRRGVALQGMSPDSDLRTGGASYFFTRLKSASDAHRRAGIVWKGKHVNRLDSVSYNHDAYGEVAGDYVTQNRKTGIAEWTATAGRARNETIFKNGLSLFDDLDVIVASTASERDAILKIFRKHGLTEWPDGRRLEDIVVNKG